MTIASTRARPALSTRLLAIPTAIVLIAGLGLTSAGAATDPDSWVDPEAGGAHVCTTPVRGSTADELTGQFEDNQVTGNQTDAHGNAAIRRDHTHGSVAYSVTSTGSHLTINDTERAAITAPGLPTTGWVNQNRTYGGFGSGFYYQRDRRSSDGMLRYLIQIVRPGSRTAEWAVFYRPRLVASGDLYRMDNFASALSEMSNQSNQVIIGGGALFMALGVAAYQAVATESIPNGIVGCTVAIAGFGTPVARSYSNWDSQRRDAITAFDGLPHWLAANSGEKVFHCTDCPGPT